MNSKNNKMSRLFKLFILFSLTYVFSGCSKDFLERPPKDEVDAEYFFNNAKDLEIASNDFYSMLPTKDVYDSDNSSDNIVPLNPSTRVRGSRIVPTGRGSGGWSWGRLRDINFFLSNYHRVDDAEARAHYSGIARFFRAYFYSEKVKRFGDVPWYNEVLEAGDEDLYKGRDSRELVMDSVLADIDYAIANIPEDKKLNRVTKYTAQFLKARIALHVGTFRKYHGIAGHEKFLEAAVTASESLISSGAYQLFVAGGKDKAYRDLFARDNQDATETILAADFERGLESHNLGYLMTAATQGGWGITKDVIDSYLMSDGSRFTDKPDYQTMEYYEEMQNRDPRLVQTTAGPNFIVNGESKLEPVNITTASTGYRVIKALPTKDQWSSAHFDIIVYRYAEVLLILAEAKAELGTLTQSDLDKSINKLRDRVEMPHLKMIEANANPDSYLANMYPNIESGLNKGILLEIRRERRIEMFNEGLRWDDLMRWKEGKKLEKPMLGIYFSSLGKHDFTGDGNTDVYLHEGSSSGAPSSTTSLINVKQKQLRDPITGNTGGEKGNLDPFPNRGFFDESKDYYYPLPTEDLNLNKNLEQNPNWN